MATLLGKAVSIESATGLSFDTPLVARARQQILRGDRNDGAPQTIWSDRLAIVLFAG